MSPTDQNITRMKHKIMEGVKEKIASQDIRDTSITDEEHFEQIINDMRQEKVINIVGLERILGKKVTRDDFKTESYDYDTWNNFFADLKNEHRYKGISHAIYTIYIQKIKSLIDPKDQGSLQAYQKCLGHHKDPYNTQDFLKQITKLSDLIKDGNIKIGKHTKLTSIRISNQELEQKLIELGYGSKGDYTPLIHQANKVADQAQMTALEEVINQQIKKAINQSDTIATQTTQNVESCFQLPSMAAVLDSYHIGPRQIARSWLQTHQGNIEGLLQNQTPPSSLQAIIDKYQHQKYQLDSLDSKEQDTILEWLSHILPESDKLQSLIYEITKKDPLIGSALQSIVLDQSTDTLSIVQKQALLDKLQVLRLSPKVLQDVNKYMKISPQHYKEFVKQILDLKTMDVSINDKLTSPLRFQSKDIVLTKGSETLHSIQDLADTSIDFVCSLNEQFETIYRNRFVGDRQYGRHDHPLFFPWKDQELHVGDQISIKSTQGVIYTGYPELTQNLDSQALQDKIQKGEKIDSKSAYTNLGLTLYQDPPSASPRQELIQITADAFDQYTYDTSNTAVFQRSFHLKGAHDLKGLLLLYPVLQEMNKLKAKDIQKTYGQSKGNNFQSRFQKSQKSDSHTSDSQKIDTHLHNQAIDHQSQQYAIANNEQAKEDFLEVWGKLGGHKDVTEPRVGDSLYFAHGESQLPKIQGYRQNSEGHLGRGHSFWTKFEIVGIDVDQGIIKGKISGVEQSLGDKEGSLMEIQMTATALEGLKKNFPSGIVKISGKSKKTFADILQSKRDGKTLPPHFASTGPGKGGNSNLKRLQSNASKGASQTLNFDQWTKKRYMGKDAHTGKDIPEQWDEIKYFGITEDVLDAKGNTRYTALMYKVEKKSKGIKVSMQNPEYNKTMSWDDFMIFVLDKGLRPYHQQDIEAIQNKVEVVAMEDDMEDNKQNPWIGAKNKGSITGFAPVDTHTTLSPFSQMGGRRVSRNNIKSGIKELWHTMEHHRHEADNMKEERVKYRILKNRIGSRLGSIRPPIGHIFSEMEGEGDFWGLDEMISKQIAHGKAELDAGVNASAKARQVLEILEHGSHLTKPSWYQNDRERLKICGYLLRCLENGGPYNRQLKKIAPKDGKRVAAILGKQHLELYKKEFDKRKLEREHNPSGESLNRLNMAEMDYIWRVIDSDEQQKLIFGSTFKSKLENGYKNDGYKKGDNIQAGRDKAGTINDFATMYEGLKGDKIGKDLFEPFMGGMRHAAGLIKNGGFKTDQMNQWSGLLLASMFSGWTLFRGDDFSQTHHFWKLGRDFGMHPMTAQMLIDKKTGGSECIGHIFDKICEAEGIQPPFSKATGWDRSKLGPGIPHSTRIAYINKFIQWRGQYADIIMPYMQLQNTGQAGKNLLDMQEGDRYINDYVETFLWEDKSPVDIDAKRHVDPTVFNYTQTGVWSFPKGMMVNQMLKFDSRGGFKGSAGEQNSSYFWNYFGKGIEDMSSANMSPAKYDFIMRKIFICFGEWFDGQSKATFLNALRLLKTGKSQDKDTAYKLLYTSTIINFKERLLGSIPGPVEEALRKFINFTMEHSHTYCTDDLVSTIFHYDKTNKDNVDAYVSRVDPRTQGLYTREYYQEIEKYDNQTLANLEKQAEQNIAEALNKHEQYQSGIQPVAVRYDNSTSQDIETIIQRGLKNTKPGPDGGDISDATQRKLEDITDPTQEEIDHNLKHAT